MVLTKQWQDAISGDTVGLQITDGRDDGNRYQHRAVGDQ